jgi:hypothetical protein
MGIGAPERDSVFIRQTKLGVGKRDGPGQHAEWLDEHALYARINPELEFKWANEQVKIDTKDANDLDNMEKAARSYIHDNPRVSKLLQKVSEKLCETEEQPVSGSGSEPEPVDGTLLVEPEPEPEDGMGGDIDSIDWAAEVTKLADELGEITEAMAWQALDDAATAQRLPQPLAERLRAARQGGPSD